MAVTQNTFTGDGSTTNYSFTFEYIKEADVKATLDGTATTAFTLANATTLSFNTAPANGVAIRIFRDTDITSLKATFFPGSAIKAEDLNDNFTQTNFAVQEADFDVATANTTANTAKTNSETAIATANTASTNASAAVTTANTASTNASAAVATANTASTNAANAVATANSASTDATNALTAATAAAAGNFATVTASTGFVGDLTGNVTGNVTGNLTGNVTGNVTGDITAASYSGTGVVTSGTSTSDTQVYSAKRSDELYYNKASVEEIASGETWVADDNKIATTAAIDARIVDLVDDVGGFVPIANETSFPNTNPDINNDSGTLISVPLANNLTSNSSGVITISNGTVGNATVTINGAENNTTYVSGFGILVETTSTLHTYNFHRYVPKATEVTTVANNISSVNTVSSNITNVNTVAGVSSNVTTVAGISSDVTTVANDGADIGTVSTNITNVNTVAGISSDVTTVAGISSNVTTVVGNATNINTVAGISSDVTTVAGDTTAINNITTNLTAVQNAATNATNAASSATAAATSETNAATSATTASTQATNAAASATTASTQATNAATSATNSATSATNSATSATNAATSETNAATSATNAATSAAAALQSQSDAAGFSVLSKSVAYNINTNTFFGSIVQAASNAFSNEITADTFLSMSLGTGSFDYGTI